MIAAEIARVVGKVVVEGAKLGYYTAKATGKAVVPSVAKGIGEATKIAAKALTKD